MTALLTYPTPIELHLSAPFEKILASLRTLPRTRAEADHVQFIGAGDSALREMGGCNIEVKEALRSLYEAAHGRQVETQIGLITIAPPIAAFLKEKPYHIATQYEFFLEAFTRIIAGDSPCKERTNGSSTPSRERLTRRRGIDAPRSQTPRVNGESFLALQRQDLLPTNE